MKKRQAAPPFHYRYCRTILCFLITLVLLYPLYMVPVMVLSFALIGSPRLLGKQFFARSMRDTTPEYNEISHEQKLEHFRTLSDVESADAELRAQGKFRLLELGIGTGANLDYYPSNCHLVATDPFPGMERYFRMALAEHDTGLTVEKFVVASATDLSCIAESSVDVVVTTMVMGYIDDYDAFFREILRVLAPGGKFYFWEHQLDPNSRSAAHAAQKYFAPFISRISDGCRIDRDLAREFHCRRQCFGELHVHHFTLEPFPHTTFLFKLFVWFLHGNMLRGVVTKKT